MNNVAGVDDVLALYDPPLTPGQAVAVKRILRGNHHFVTGSAGTGKTRTLAVAVEQLRQRRRTPPLSPGPWRVLVLCPTHAAAECAGNGATTFHSALALKPGTLETADPLPEPDPQAVARLSEVDTVVIDEVSMVGERLLCLLWVALVRGEARRGHVAQMVAFGDLAQLGPVVTRDCPLVASLPAHASVLWKNMFGPQGRTTRLGHAVRQKDAAFFAALEDVRRGAATALVRRLVETASTPARQAWAKSEAEAVPHVFCLRREANAHNDEVIGRLLARGAESRVFVTGKWCDGTWAGEAALEELERQTTVPPRLVVVVGSLFLVRANLDPARGFRVGALVRIVGFVRYPPAVGLFPPGMAATAAGLEPVGIVVRREDWEEQPEMVITWRPLCAVSSADPPPPPVAALAQMPLQPAFAFTVHALQGVTVEGPLAFHPQGSFTAGIVYTALTRVTRPDHLIICADVAETLDAVVKYAPRATM